jgi:hypothetical protein
MYDCREFEPSGLGQLDELLPLSRRPDRADIATRFTETFCIVEPDNRFAHQRLSALPTIQAFNKAGQFQPRGVGDDVGNFLTESAGAQNSYFLCMFSVYGPILLFYSCWIPFKMVDGRFCPPAFENRHNGQAEYFDIRPQRDVLHIPQVHGEFLISGDGVATVYLCPAGDARQHIMTPHLSASYSSR